MGTATTVKERPIRAYAHEVRAILDGRMSQLRRVIKPQPTIAEGDIFPCQVNEKDRTLEEHLGKFLWPTEKGEFFDFSPYGRPGDRLYVRETWGYEYGGGFLYRASHGHMQPDGRWRPPIHMPRAACRLILEITHVRVERLQDISEADAVAEGCYTNDEYGNLAGTDNLWPCPHCSGWQVHPCLGQNYGVTECDCTACDTAQKRFSALWQSINSPESWAANPLVWVVSFKKI